MSDFAPQFDTEVNNYLLENTQDNKSNMLSSLMGGAVASAVDIGASIFNSLPGVDEVDTEEILGRIGGDALRVFQENPDTIRTISLIGGALLPGAVAVKGLNALRNGSKAVNWFTTAGKQADIAKAAEMVANGGKATAEYKKLMWGMRGKTVANNLLDTAAAEVAILGAFNAHPYMEDYLEDPLKNFGVSMLIGGGIGSVAGLIGNNFALKNATAKVEENAIQQVINLMRPVPETAPNATQIQEMEISIKNLDGLIKQRKELGKQEDNDLVYQYAQKFKRDLELEQSTLFDKILPPELRDLAQGDKDPILAWLRSDMGAHGIEKIDVYNPKELADKFTVTNKLADEPALFATTKDGMANTPSYYIPEIKKYGTKKDIEYYAGAASTGKSVDDVVKQYPDKLSYTPNTDYSFEVLGKSTASVDTDFVGWTAKYGKMDDEALEKYLQTAVYAPDDIPQLQALSARLAQSPTLQKSAKIKVAGREIAEAKEAMILEGVDAKRTLGGTPVKYQTALQNILNNDKVEDLYAFDVGNTLLSDWIQGQTFPLMKAATAYFARGFASRSRSGADIEAAAEFANIYEHPKSVQLRKDLAKLADKDGKIYLYRGVNAPKIFGQAPLESMAVTVDKTRQFTKGEAGKTLLYKVDVEDVVTSFVDIGPKGDNVEVVVRTTAREAEAVLDNTGRIKFREQLSKSLAPAKKYEEVRSGDLNDMVASAKYTLVQNMLNRGFPVEVISKRANIPEDTLQRFMATDLTLESFEASGDLVKYKTLEDAAEAMAPKNRPLKVSGNLRKQSYTKMHSDLNAAAITNIDQMFKATILMNSKAESVRSIGSLIFEEGKGALDIARMQLHKVTNEAAGNRFFTSADQFARKMGDLGPIFSYVGKQLEKIANNTVQRVVQPITDVMIPVSKDRAALAEFAVAQNLNASLQGFRVYKDGKFWQKVEKIAEDGKKVTVLEPVKYNGADFQVVTPIVDKLLTEIQNRSGELYDLSNASNKILGKADLNNLGFWMPAFNPVNKFIAYAHDKATDTTQVIYGKTPETLEQAIKVVQSANAKNENFIIVRKDDQEWWSKLNGRLDTINMKVADVGMLKTGSGATAIPTITTDILAEVAGGYEHYINSRVRNLADLSMSDITDRLRDLSSFNQRGFANQPLSAIRKAVYRPKDAAKSMENILLGNPSLGEYEGWKSLNTSIESAVGVAANAVQNIWQTLSSPTIRNPLRKGTPSVEDMRKFDFIKFEEELKNAGVVSPFAGMDQALAIEAFGLSTLTDNPDISKRLVSASNSLAATLALRFAELAHPLVNLMSMPILTSLANSKSLPATFMGVKKATINVPTTQVMYEGIRSMNSPAFEMLNKKWEELGYFKPLVSEASDILRQSRQFEKGALTKIENALDSKFVDIMSKPADWSETMSRKVMMNTGYHLGKRLYPELDDTALTIFARDFMDKALGNYSASQRPTFFQGTLGVAMGLFQTYMLTMAQNIYRNVEFKDWKTLAKGMLAQSTIFGTSSLPGFNQVSEAIADNFSDDNVDLTTGTYRALRDPAASWILYGLPSNLTGGAFFTRGDVDPRFPNVLAGVENLAGASFAVQTAEAMNNFIKSVKVDNEDVGHAFMQAMSLQSMSRPLARTAELFTGYSVNQQGNTVAVPDEVRTFGGIAARIFAVRPMEEAKLREAMHLNRYYETLDRDKRDSAVEELKVAIRNGTLTDEKIAEVAERYMRFGGSPTGWRAAYNNALAKTNASGEDTFLDKLKDDSPFHYMISNLD